MNPKIILLIASIMVGTCRNTESNIQSIEVCAQGYWTSHTGRHSCQDFRRMPCVSNRFYTYTEIKEVSQMKYLAQILKKAPKSSDDVESLDVLAKMVLHSTNSTDSICADRFRFYYKGVVYDHTDDMKDFIWGTQWRTMP
jgi:hypothetical protein